MRCVFKGLLSMLRCDIRNHKKSVSDAESIRSDWENVGRYLRMYINANSEEKL